MNFKKFHESRNLFDESTLQNGYYGGGDDDYASYRPDDKYRAFAMNLVAGTYTLRIYCDVSIKLLRVSNSIDGRVTVATDDQPYTFTLAGDATIYVSFRNQTTTNNFPNLKVMLNTGSTALPYEPYSPEVWHDTPHYIHNTATDIITTPADIYANDTTATVGLKGQMEQSGTPSPTTPIQPSETGERTGNLFDITAYSVYKDYPSVNGVSFTAEDNNYTINGNATANATVYLLSNGSFPIDGEMTLSFAYSSGTIKGAFQSTKLGWKDLDAGRKTFTFDNDTITNIWIQVPSGKSADHIKLNFIINTGSTALPYEPYGIKIPIQSANTTTPVYLGEVQTTRKIKKLVLTGEETINYNSSNNTFNFILNNGYYTGSVRTTPLFSSHYIHIDDGRPFSNMPNNSIYVASFGSATAAYIYSTNYADLDDFKAYLAAQYAAGTPVTVWYILATPTTGIVNEPLRKIGDYADEVSGISIPTIAGANTISVDTTLQPSEVTATYKGWHPVADVHEAENGQWD